jgi:hypothetical protein
MHEVYQTKFFCKHSPILPVYVGFPFLSLVQILSMLNDMKIQRQQNTPVRKNNSTCFDRLYMQKENKNKIKTKNSPLSYRHHNSDTSC